MRGITRRVFLKAAALIGATLAIGKYIGSRKLSVTELFELGEARSAEGEKDVTIVSDVDAHSQCSMRVSVKEGKVIEIRGDPADPESKGELTLRGKYMREILYAPDRLRYPMKRAVEKGEGKWKRISWNEALTTIANRLREIKNRYGPEAMDFHHGHYHSGDVIGPYLARLANLIGIPNVSKPSYVCHLPRVFLQFNYDFGILAPSDVAYTNCIILWGGNPEATNKPQHIAIKEARERGAKLVVIDPRVISYAEGADIHAQLRPGTDGALAVGVLNVIIEEGLYDREFTERWTIGFEKLEKHIEHYSPREGGEDHLGEKGAYS